VTTTLSIPKLLNDITPAWLTAALHEGGAIKAATVVTAAECRSVGAGAGFLAQLGIFTLTYDRADPGAPPTLIAKIPAADQGGRDVSNLFDFYYREIRFYEDISSRVDLSTARRYYSSSDRAAQDYVLLMENLSESSHCGDEVAGCTIEECELAIDSIAGFHVQWWNNTALEALDWMPDLDAPIHHATEPAYQQAWGPMCQMFGDAMSPRIRAMGEKIQPHIVDLLHMVAPAPRTIIHGDFRADNVFFGTGGNTPPFSVIDWQISSKGRGVFDVAYFLASSVDPALRKAHEMRLLHRWYDRIAVHDKSGYTFEKALHDYRVCMLYMHVYTVIGLGSLNTANERGMKLFSAWLTRRSAAIEDLDADELMPR